MFINNASFYIPEGRLENDFFSSKYNLSHEFIYQRTGIVSRSIASEDENTNTMSVSSVEKLITDNEDILQNLELIVGATYSPFDTVGTLAHAVQQKFSISGAMVVSISAACSSFINSLEIVEGYFSSGKADKALVVTAEHNSKYYNLDDPYSGYLWGDGAASFIISNEKSDNSIEIIDISTMGLAEVDKGPEGVFLRPRDGGIRMPHGKNVFLNACKYMTESTAGILEKNNYSKQGLSYLITHQANKRITDNVRYQLEIDESKVLTNIEKYGNTGNASSGIVLAENWDKFKDGNIIAVTVFGGGYSCGTALLKK
ncbi:MAG: 3-oxoacyl-ACP synthase [Marinilabiliales bacterium]|nr:MAG: 3-oxoacyl-ACP synthase [Marinilabiliales bacterium]